MASSAGVSQRHQADGARHQGQAEAQQGIEPGVGEDLQDIGIRQDERKQGQGDRHREQRPGGHVERLAGRDEGPGHRLGRRLALAGEQSVGPQDQDDDQQDEGEEVAIARAEQGDAVALDEAQQDAARDGAGHVAHAADDLGDDALQGRLEAHRRVDVVVIHADQQAAHRAQARGDGEHRAVHGVDVDAHLLRGVAVLRRGAHRPAQPREAQEKEQQSGAGDADEGDHEVERADRARTDLEAIIQQRAGQGARIGRESELDELVEHEAEADRGQQRRDVRLALQRTQAEALDAETEQRADGDDDRRWSAATACRDGSPPGSRHRRPRHRPSRGRS